MQIFRHKVSNYNGIGNAAVFYSGLYHRSVYACEGTIKVAFFRYKNTSTFMSKFMDGSKPYPDNLIITRTTMNNIPEKYRGKIRIFNKIDVFDQIIKDEGNQRMKQGKASPITCTKMKMYKWEDTNRTEQRQQMENSLFEMYNIG